MRPRSPPPVINSGVALEKDGAPRDVRFQVEEVFAAFGRLLSRPTALGWREATSIYDASSGMIVTFIIKLCGTSAEVTDPLEFVLLMRMAARYSAQISSNFDKTRGNLARLGENMTTDQTGGIEARGYTIASYSMRAVSPPDWNFWHTRMSDLLVIDPDEEPIHEVLILKKPISSLIQKQ